jgi:hypothetical protein
MRPHKALLLSAGVMLAALVAMVVLPESPLDAGAAVLFIAVSPAFLASLDALTGGRGLGVDVSRHPIQRRPCSPRPPAALRRRRANRA